MKIGVPKEIKPQEHRIGLTPESVKTLISEGHEVLVENNGGFEAGFENEQYTNVGAKTGVNLSTLGSSVAMIGERITTDSMRLLFVGEINDGNPQPIMSMHNLTGDVAIGKTDATEFSGLTFTGHMLDVLGVIQTRNGTINMGGATYRKASISTPVGDADTPYLQFGVTDVANSSSIGTTGGWRMTNSGLHSSNRDNYITFYADEHANHSIGSRNIDGDESDDIRINTYGSLLINLDSNDNNSDGGDFVVGRHGRNSTITTNNTISTTIPPKTSTPNSTSTIPYIIPTAAAISNNSASKMN